MPSKIISPILSELNQVYLRHKGNFSGFLANYIPELSQADPNHFGICLATVDGMVYEMGFTRVEFSIQSISKVFTYGLALSDHGPEKILKHVGVEPSGDAFNSIVFDERTNRPFNPMVNAGAIVTTALIKGQNLKERCRRIVDLLGKFAGRQLQVDQKVYHSEKSTGHRNRAIAYLELNSKMIEEPIEDHLDVYFQQCSVLVNAHDLAIMAATLANQGINPLTGERVEKPENICRILSVMQSCGMYDFSGEWIFRVGLPAKSGISGGIIAVVPGYMGIGIYSPLINASGNSERGVRVCEDLSKNFNLHMFAVHPPLRSVIRRRYSGAEVQSKRQRNMHEKMILNAVGANIHVYELQGDLFFSSIEQLCRHFSHPTEELRFVIIDGMHVGRIDCSVSPILNTLKEMLKEKNIHLFIAGATSSLYEALSKESSWGTGDFFETTEQALEYCENDLIASHDPHHQRKEKLPLKELDIAENLTKEEIEVLKSLVTEVSYHSGDVIIREGDNAEELFILAEGVAGIHICLKHDPKIYRRVGAISSGITFGEVGLFYGGKRTAKILAEEHCVCYVLRIADFEKLAIQHPGVHAKLLINVGRVLSDRLRQANDEICILSN